jgi:hypothetical protein
MVGEMPSANAPLRADIVPDAKNTVPLAVKLDPIVHKTYGTVGVDRRADTATRHRTAPADKHWALDAMTYQIYHYPAELIDVVHLSDGERVVIRPVLPQDRELMVAFFHDLSPGARCNRSFRCCSKPAMPSYFTVKGHRHWNPVVFLLSPGL